MQNADVEGLMLFGYGVAEKRIHHGFVFKRDDPVRVLSPYCDAETRLLAGIIGQLLQELVLLRARKILDREILPALLYKRGGGEPFNAVHDPVGRPYLKPVVIHAREIHHHVVERLFARRIFRLLEHELLIVERGLVPVMPVGYEKGFFLHGLRYLFYGSRVVYPPDPVPHSVVSRNVYYGLSLNRGIEKVINGLFLPRARVRPALRAGTPMRRVLAFGIDGEDATEVGVAGLHEAEPVGLRPRKGFFMGAYRALAGFFQSYGPYESLPRGLFSAFGSVALKIGVKGGPLVP